jgi:hypothetical protein
VTVADKLAGSDYGRVLVISPAAAISAWVAHAAESHRTRDVSARSAALAPALTSSARLGVRDA